MTYATGVDVGSTQTKAIVIDEHGQVVGRALLNTGANAMRAADKAFQAALDNANIAQEEVAAVVETGYGCPKEKFGDVRIADVSCHARGALHFFPQTRTVLDMGGHDSKAIRISGAGEVISFCMNDKCGSGAGRFLQDTAATFEIPLGELGTMATSAVEAAPISTTCTVFAQAEMYSWLGRGRKFEEILLGVHRALAQQSFALLQRVGITEQITCTGGVAQNAGIVRSLNELLGLAMNTSEESQFVGALGAALFALDRMRTSRSPVAAKRHVMMP